MTSPSPFEPWDPEFCEREYNARASIPDAAEFVEGWTRRARETRERIAGTPGTSLDLAYGRGAKERVDLIVPPKAAEPPPLLVFIHGGYWRSLDKDDFTWVAPAFVERGIAVAVPNYDLVPTVTMEDIVRQMLAAVGWLWRQAPGHGVDRDRIVVAGHSAGGHLAAMMGCAQWPRWDARLPVDAVKGVLSISGLHEIEPLRHAPFLARSIALDAERARLLSPALMTPPAHVRAMTAVGGDESGEFHRQARLLAERWGDSFVRDVPMPGCDHLRVCARLAEPDSALFAAALELLQR